MQTSRRDSRARRALNHEISTHDVSVIQFYEPGVTVRPMQRTNLTDATCANKKKEVLDVNYEVPEDRPSSIVSINSVLFPNPSCVTLESTLSSRSVALNRAGWSSDENLL